LPEIITSQPKDYSPDFAPSPSVVERARIIADELKGKS
jgi:hypothetical protein